MFRDVLENGCSGKEDSDAATGAGVASCEFSKISKNTFFTEHLSMTASED